MAEWLVRAVQRCKDDNGWDDHDAAAVIAKLQAVIRSPSDLVSAQLADVNRRLTALGHKALSRSSFARLQLVTRASEAGVDWLAHIVGGCMEANARSDSEAQEVLTQLRAAGIEQPRHLATVCLVELNKRLVMLGHGDISAEVFDRLQHATMAQLPRTPSSSGQGGGFARLPAGRTFGVEIEVCNISSTVLLEKLRRQVPDVEFERQPYNYDSYNRSTWIVKDDGSVPWGAELVSPILAEVAGLRRLREVVGALRDVGAKVNKNCGLHVHVGISDFRSNSGKVSRLVCLHESAAPVVDTLVAPSRRGSRWCKPTHRDAVERAKTGSISLEEVLHGDRWRSLREDRYVALNMWHHRNISRRTGPTVEFRKHGGTKNATKVVSWVAFCVSMVEAAAQHEALIWESPELVALRHAGAGEQALRHLLRLLGMLDCQEADVREAAEYLLARQAHFSSRPSTSSAHAASTPNLVQALRALQAVCPLQ